MEKEEALKKQHFRRELRGIVSMLSFSSEAINGLRGDERTSLGKILLDEVEIISSVDISKAVDEPGILKDIGTKIIIFF